ncbi:AraC family transcriptional regulator [Ligilactobacillus acidipiscis]|uniref:AraC family transcriptional regulator n=1 Tax=Ligilactobacillus acidipiscis TaxID=89059 RepID=UPI0022E939C7|nr:AraC family transcriptional regulator [Ligilactobacillus acidipiscis]
MKQLFIPEDKLPKNQPHIVYMSKVDVQDSGYPRTMHSHADIVELILLTSGKGNVFIGEQYFPAMKGDLLVYNSQVLHDELFKNDSVSLYCIGIAGLKEKHIRANALITDDEQPVVTTHKYYEPLFNLFKTCYELLEDRCVNFEKIVQHIFSAILLLLKSNLLNSQRKVAVEQKVDLVQEIKRYMDQHFTADFKIKNLQRSSSPISEFYFAHKFKELYGYTPIEYIRRRRIGEAQTLLITTDKSITEIAFSVGFNSSSYFCTTFKKIVDLTPKQYRIIYTERKQDS